MFNRSNLNQKDLFRQYFFVGIFFIFLFTACGDSGSSSSSSNGGDQGLTYEGVETQAVITESNAAQLSANSLSAGADTTAFSTIAAVQDPSTMGGTDSSILPSVAMVINDAARQMDTYVTGSVDVSTAVQRQEGSIPGDCADGESGSASYTIEVNQDQGTFTGTLTFNDYCVDYTHLDGSTTISGTMDMQTQEMTNLTLDFDELTSSSEDISMTYDGTIEIDTLDTSVTSTMNMLIKNNLTEKTYKVEDYVMTIEDNGSERSVQVSGKFYDPDYGYVVLSTVEPLMYEYDAVYPYSGQLTLEGAAGSAGGPTTAQLTAVSSTTCQLQVDTNGDGDYDDLNDFDSGVILWEDLGR